MPLADAYSLDIAGQQYFIRRLSGQVPSDLAGAREQIAEWLRDGTFVTLELLGGEPLPIHFGRLATARISE